MEAKEKAKEEISDSEEEKAKKEAEEEPWDDEREGSFPHSVYPPPPVLEEEVRDDHPRQEDQEEPTEDEWYCPHCRKSPCLFLQWEEELDRHVDIMYPEVSNVAKWFHMYHHMSHQLHGPLRKGERKKLLGCFETGLRAMFPIDWYVGFKLIPFITSGPR
jgi:hypothetical protein